MAKAGRVMRKLRRLGKRGLEILNATRSWHLYSKQERMADAGGSGREGGYSGRISI
jgi:hypothetical protein